METLSFSAALKEAREKANLPQRAVSKLLKIPSRTYESWEMGERKPQDYVQPLILEKLASLTGQLSEDIANQSGSSRKYRVFAINRETGKQDQRSDAYSWPELESTLLAFMKEYANCDIYVAEAKEK